MLSDSEIDQKKHALGHIPAFINTAGFEATGRRARQGIRPKHSSYNNDSQQLVLPHAWTSSTGTDGRTKAKVQLERSLIRSEDAQRKQYPAGGRELTKFKTIWHGQGTASTPLEQQQVLRQSGQTGSSAHEPDDGSFRKPIKPQYVSSPKRPAWALYGEGGANAVLGVDSSLRCTHMFSKEISATTRTALLKARKQSATMTLNARFGGDMADPHSFGPQTPQASAFSARWTAVPAADSGSNHAETKSLPNHSLRSELLQSRRLDSSLVAKSKLGMPLASSTATANCTARASKTLSQRRRQIRQEQRISALAAAPAESLGVHRKPLPKFACDSSRPWYAVQTEGFKCSVERPFATAVQKVTDNIGARSVSLASTRPLNATTPISKATTSLVKLREAATKYKLPQNPAKVDHFDMANAAGRSYKPEFSTGKRWTSALIDHIKLTEESNSRSQAVKVPKGLINPREFAPLFSSFSADNIFRERTQKGTNLRADAEIEETPVGESMRRERRQGQVYGEFAPLASDEERVANLDHIKEARDRRVYAETTAIQMPLTPATLRLANRRNSSDAFEEFAVSAAFNDSYDAASADHSRRYSTIKSAPQRTARRLKPTAQHRFAASNRFHVRTAASYG